jgi:hypothetical protein
MSHKGCHDGYASSITHILDTWRVSIGYKIRAYSFRPPPMLAVDLFIKQPIENCWLQAT